MARLARAVGVRLTLAPAAQEPSSGQTETASGHVIIIGYGMSAVFLGRLFVG